MSTQPPRTCVSAMLDRSQSPALAASLATSFEASGVVDDFFAGDILVSWWPNCLWVPENTPLAEAIQDVDSWHDAFLLAAIAASATERLGVAISTDAIRRGPAELMMTMLTLASATDGNATVFLGAGEYKQCDPFGHKRSEGLARTEDLLRIFRLFWASDEPFDHDGNVWKLKKAWLGLSRPHRPKFFAMGGGPKLIDLAARYADGWVTDVPGVFSTPEQYADAVADVRRKVESYGRDPEEFAFGMTPPCLIHDDAGRVDEAYTNPLMQFFAAGFGRLNQGDWEKEGIQSVFPRDWHYSLKLYPPAMSPEEVHDICRRTPKQLVEKSVLSGTTKEVASTLGDYAEAGATWVLPFDLMPALLPPDEAQAAIGHVIEVCRLVKQA